MITRPRGNMRPYSKNISRLPVMHAPGTNSHQDAENIMYAATFMFHYFSETFAQQKIL